MATDARDLNLKARQLLQLFHADYVAACGGTSIVMRGSRQMIAEFGDALEPSFDLLSLKRLISRVSDDGYTITDQGLEAVDDEETLERLLPISVIPEAVVGSPEARDIELQKYELNEKARALLSLLYRCHVQNAGRPFGVSPRQEAFTACGFANGAEFKRASSWLIRKNLAKYMGMGPVTITSYGAEVAGNPAALDEALPIAPPSLASQSIPGDVAESLQDIRRIAINFVSDADFQNIMERDIIELECAVANSLHKSVALLAGSIVEALLADVVGRRPDLARSYMGRKTFPADASIDKLVEIAVGESLIESLAASLVASIKDYRDLIHPDRERRTRAKVDRPTTFALLSLLRLVLRDLDDANRDGRIAAYQAK